MISSAGEVAVVAVGVDDQRRWFRSADVAVDEIWLQFSKGVRVFISRLRRRAGRALSIMDLVGDL